MKCTEAYYMTPARGLFLCKCIRTDIQPTVAVLCTRVKDPNEAAEWGKLVRLMMYLNGSRKKRHQVVCGRKFRCPS